jgi:hypothetical protein
VGKKRREDELERRRFAGDYSVYYKLPRQRKRIERERKRERERERRPLSGFWRIGSWIGAIRNITLFCGSDLDRLPISNLPGMIGMAILWRATNPILFLDQIGLDDNELQL